MTDWFAEADLLFSYTQGLRRDFHRHPELGFQEVRTAGIVAKELRDLSLEVSTGIAETGVVAIIEGTQPGPVALLRFDMDALPVEEETGAEYASEIAGKMHACGHDGHTSIGLTVARLLQKHRDKLCGSVKLVFQPAEEGLGGAERMIDQGVLKNPRPDRLFALHLWNERPLGWIGVSPGPVMAASDIFSIRVHGKGGHGAVPNLAVDPVLASAQVITALQSIVARNVSPLSTAVISVTAVHGGEAFNVIPPYVDLQGTIRTFEPATRKRVIDHFYQVVNGVTMGLGCSPEITITPLTPALINDPALSEQVMQVAGELFPSGNVDTSYRTMGSEDMAFMMQQVPGCYFFIGSANSERGLDAAHHHPKFDFDERALVHAAALMSAVAADFLSGKTR